MKTFVIMLSQTFLATHPKKGEETGFEKKFRNQKIHTIRDNYALWKERFEKIEAGEACLSVRKWEGEPYKSKQIELACLTCEDGISLQKLEFIQVGENGWNCSQVKIDDRLYDTALVAQCDGLSRQDWLDWFLGNPKNKLHEPFAVINFTWKSY